LIRATHQLECADRLIKKADRPDLLRSHRPTSQQIDLNGKNVRLQSQRPLHSGNIQFEGGWKLEDLIERLNGLVFFWPGTEAKPVKSGRNHFESTSWSKLRPVVLRSSTVELFETNPRIAPLFCLFNSGSPRFSQGRPSPRGPSTFLSEDQFPGNRSEVVELVFPLEVDLPERTEYATSLNGSWKHFFIPKRRLLERLTLDLQLALQDLLAEGGAG
jgi:hypothetical protein